MSLSTALFAEGDFTLVRAALIRELGGDANAAVVLQRIWWRCSGPAAVDGWWRGTYEEIAADAGMTRDQVKRVMKKLKDTGLLNAEKRGSDPYDQALSYQPNTTESPETPIGQIRPMDRAESPDVPTRHSPSSSIGVVVGEVESEPAAAPPSFSPPKVLQYEHTWAPPPAAITAVCNAATVLVPDEHLDHYLARCSELKKKPSGAEWVRWFMKDQNDRRAADRLAAQSNEPLTDDSGVPLSWR